MKALCRILYSSPVFSQLGTYKSLNKFSWRDTYIWFCQYNEEEEAALLCLFFKHIYVLLGNIPRHRPITKIVIPYSAQ